MITVDELRGIALFHQLPEDRLKQLASRAADIDAAPGDYVVHEGEVPAFYVVLAGTLEVTKRLRGVERILGKRRHGSFFGETPLLMGSATFANLRVTGHERARLLRVDDVEFHALLDESPPFSRAVMKKVRERLFAINQINLETPVAQATIIGESFDVDCHDLRDFLARNEVRFAWRKPEESNPHERADEAKGETPIVELPDGRVLHRPTVRELAIALNVPVNPAKDAYDLVVVGAGPAGLAASVYGASEGLTTLTIEREAPGGQAGTSSRIENYLGFPNGISGDDLGDRAHRQARRLGAEIVVTRDAIAIEPGAGNAPHVVTLDGDQRVQARAIVLAMGVSWRRLEVDGVDRYTGRGVYYGAARTEAQGVLGKDIYLVGAGNSAGQAAVFFAAYARRVTLLVRGPSIEDSMSAYLVQQLHERPNVSIETGVEITSVLGNDHLSHIDLRRAEAVERRAADAVFVFIGADAETAWLPAAIARDQRGYVLTGRSIPEGAWTGSREPYFLETSVPRIFAAGDVRHDSIKRVASGVGEGSTAIALIHQALAEEPVPA